MAEKNLFVVATPIGNLADITERAIQTLKEVDLICAEDTRHTSKLMNHLGISNRLIPLHDHNEQDKAPWVIEQLAAGKSVALVSDAGTPLISDPGYHLVKEVRAAGFNVVPVPGASAIITALSAAGIASDRFAFEGFLPAKSKGRQDKLNKLKKATHTLVFYESTHRILASLEDIAAVLGDRRMVIARELTKTFETFLDGTPNALLTQLKDDDNQTRGEFVLLIEGAEEEENADQALVEKTLEVLVAALPTKQAAQATADIFGLKKNELYARALELKKD